MHDYPELTHARKDMLVKSELYQPTTFWNEASSRIETELCTNGIEHFRRLSNPLGFFVPTYGTPGSSFTDDQGAGLLGWLRREFTLPCFRATNWWNGMFGPLGSVGRNITSTAT